MLLALTLCVHVHALPETRAVGKRERDAKLAADRKILLINAVADAGAEQGETYLSTAVSATSKAHQALGKVPAVRGTPCSAACEGDPGAEACASCCRSAQHEADWGCGGDLPAGCCLGEWKETCWDVGSDENNGHACNQCAGDACENACFTMTCTHAISSDQFDLSCANIDNFATIGCDCSECLGCGAADGPTPSPPPPTPPPRTTTFANKLALQTAVDLWCSDEPAALATYGNISNWDVSAITDMKCLFAYSGCSDGGSTYGKDTCNPDVGAWNVSAVVKMGHMFRGAISFDKNIDSWDTSSVTAMSYMFRDATSFDKDISSWSVSAVDYMSGMFYGATSLSDCNKALIHYSFDAQTSAWTYGWGSLCQPSPPPPASASPSPPPASPTGVCGDGTALDAVTRKCEVVLDEFTEVVGGKCAVACSDNRRLDEAQEEGEEAAAASIVNRFLARHADAVAELRRANLDEKVIKMMLKLGQDFRLPALA